MKLLFSSQILLQLTLDGTADAIKKSTVELPLHTDQRTRLTDHEHKEQQQMVMPTTTMTNNIYI